MVDLKAGRAERSLTGDGPSAALFAPEFNQIYVTRGRNVCLYGGTSFDLVATVPLDSTDSSSAAGAHRSSLCSTPRPENK
jgi:hypothetical protein